MNVATSYVFTKTSQMLEIFSLNILRIEVLQFSSEKKAELKQIHYIFFSIEKLRNVHIILVEDRGHQKVHC